MADQIIQRKYTVIVGCRNCLAENPVSIPLGTTVEKFLEQSAAPCMNCMCMTLDPHVVGTLRFG